MAAVDEILVIVQGIGVEFGLLFFRHGVEYPAIEPDLTEIFHRGQPPCERFNNPGRPSSTHFDSGGKNLCAGRLSKSQGSTRQGFIETCRGDL
jgi:hypothetical protein